ncbi:hypothetical protein PYW07_008326 [Mythimna separata]|uniref:Helicase ATP-binding domain-containing protein n=1 Tax=Mythimna separata TaxID=271217 RepID=A0AAD7YCG5_MYTSE|nr:hypothetical protein PYW07_008326 [Mythimna separata]
MVSDDVADDGARLPRSEKSIYDKPEQSGECSSTSNRQEKTPYRENSEEESLSKNQVTIHKRPRLGSAEYEDDSKTSIPHTPPKTVKTENPETPECVSLPTIYYGARTHTQLKQVIKEFKRTSYCGLVKMTLLSSRDKSCIKEFDKSQWSSRNDMCRACVKPIKRSEKDDNKENTNCAYYDNRAALSHGCMPAAFDLEELVEVGREKQACPFYGARAMAKTAHIVFSTLPALSHGCMPAAFDLEELVEIGREKQACPFYGARAMAKTAHIVFCPYNYLIDPSIRTTLLVLSHGCMPAAFDLEELVEIGREKQACPFYGARAMAKTAHIVFCPYNYLIDPSIRSNLCIELQGAVVIVDEAHNIEGICREVASVTITKAQIQTSIKELENVMSYRFANQDVAYYVEDLLKTLKSWEYWFENQTPLVNQQPVNNNEAVLKWEANQFVDTLNNHNIGYKQYGDFRRNSENFCRRLREDPRPLYGVTQSTGTLLDEMNMVFGFLFRCECKYVDDFKPALIRHVTGKTNSISNTTGWRSSQFNEWVSNDTLSLSLMCMNPAIVMEGLHPARCIALASGTLTPLISLHSELATSFPHRVSPNHVIPQDRVSSIRQGDTL